MPLRVSESLRGLRTWRFLKNSKLLANWLVTASSKGHACAGMNMLLSKHCFIGAYFLLIKVNISMWKVLRMNQGSLINDDAYNREREL